MCIRDSNDGGFTSSCQADDHDSVTDHDGLHQLDDLCQEFLWLLIVSNLELVLNGSLKTTVVDVRNCNRREQIYNNAHEEWQVVF